MNDPLIVGILLVVSWGGAIISGIKKDGTLAGASIVFMFLCGLRLVYLLFLS